MDRIIIGIDISKKKFDACLALQEPSAQKWKYGTFDNTQAGFKAFADWVNRDSQKSYHAVMEATGRYGEDLANFLYESGCDVSVVNPAQIKYYSRSLLKRAKTDKVDSQLIAEFAQRHELHLWKPLSTGSKAFKEQVRCLDAFKADAVQTNHRLEQAKDPQVKAMLGERLSHIRGQITQLKKELKQLVEKDSSLKLETDLLESIPGIGETSAYLLLAELPDLETFTCAKQLGAYAGLNPSIRTSGTSINGRGSLSRVGSKTLRKILYFPALSLMRTNSALSPFIERLRARGKKGMVIVGAVMHKLMHIIFGVLKKRKAFLSGEATA
jgi:transposase